MSVLLMSEVFPPRHGGSGRWFWEVYRRLPRSAVAIVAGDSPGHEAFDGSHDLRLTRLPLTLPSWGVASPGGMYRHGRLVQAVRRLQRHHGTTAVHCGKCLPEGTVALALKWLTGTPYLVYVHGEELKLAAGSRELTWLTRRVLNGARLLIANSRNTAGILRDDWAVPETRIRVVHPGVDVERFAPAAPDPAVRARLGWGDRPVVLTVGRLQKRKGQDTMIRALARVRRSVPDVLYAIAGDGEERGALEELIARESLGQHVLLMGEVSESILLDCYRQCDLFVLPNRRVGADIEGFGMVLVEAQACGRPVVAGDSGGTAETMDVPHTGRIVSCDGPDALAETVAQLLGDADLRARMGVQARRWACKHFDWNALGRQAADLFAAEPKVVRGARHSVRGRLPNSLRL